MSDERPLIYLARHGETEWSLTGQHTGRTDIPLTARGEDEARRLGARLREWDGHVVWSSPLQRAHRTCELAGFGDQVHIDPDLAEWHYGEYEGLTTAEIHQRHADWLIFRDGCPGGESPDDVTSRADRMVARLLAGGPRQLVFSHGHLLRVLAARWCRLPITAGACLLLDTASLNALSFDHHNRQQPAIRFWNDSHHLRS